MFFSCDSYDNGYGIELKYIPTEIDSSKYKLQLQLVIKDENEIARG